MANPVTAEDDRTRNIRSCLESAEAWRQNARYVRQHAARPHLNPQARAVLLREAEASDRQAEWWVNGAEEYQRG
jgi:hypothetical protein